MPERSPIFELLKEEYVALRAEILQSISYQHQILLAGYAANGALFGYIAGMSQPLWAALVIVPFLFLAMTALWIVECNRMMRAGYYIGAVLWPEMKRCIAYPGNAGWEAWIRQKKENNKVAWRFSKTQHKQQRFAAQIVPMIISIISIIVAITSSFHEKGAPTFSLTLVSSGAIVLWCLILRNIRSVSDLSALLLDIQAEGPHNVEHNKAMMDGTQPPTILSSS